MGRMLVCSFCKLNKFLQCFWHVLFCEFSLHVRGSKSFKNRKLQKSIIVQNVLK